MLQNYLPVLIFLTVATGLALVLLSLGLVIGRLQAKAKFDKEKLSPYECGFEAFEDSRMKFDVRYYLVAILFIISGRSASSRWEFSCSSWSWASSTNGRKEHSSGIDPGTAERGLVRRRTANLRRARFRHHVRRHRL
jgi:hypothetical protein